MVIVITTTEVILYATTKPTMMIITTTTALLQKLNIRPFSYGLVIDCVFDNGSIFRFIVVIIEIY